MLFSSSKCPLPALVEWCRALRFSLSAGLDPVRIFKQQKWGRILNLSSVQQRLGSPNMLPYAMSKGAISTLTNTLAKDLGKEGITVNAIAPGYFNTYRNRMHVAKHNHEEGVPWPTS